jgi:sporulation protein YlmC with PRC-barrel domain
MKRLGTVAVALSLLSLPLGTVAFWGDRETLIEAETVVGSPVRNTEGKDMGRVKNLLINLKDGKIAYAVVTRGGILGLGAKSIAVAWSDLTVGRDEGKVVLTTNREVLEKAPRAEENKGASTKERMAAPQKKAQ